MQDRRMEIMEGALQDLGGVQDSENLQIEAFVELSEIT